MSRHNYVSEEQVGTGSISSHATTNKMEPVTRLLDAHYYKTSKYRTTYIA